MTSRSVGHANHRGAPAVGLQSKRPSRIPTLALDVSEACASSNSRTLSDADVDAIAFRVAEVLGRATTESVLVDAAEAASILSVDRGYVYRHAAKLGAVKLGDGPRARLRFPIARLDD
jgi:hypothetical protein